MIGGKGFDCEKIGNMVKEELTENRQGNGIISFVSKECIVDITEVGTTERNASGFMESNFVGVGVKIKK